jgi:acetylornithine deacetylase/succinyl-diaminopimelate desuccinylase-like protein
MQIEVTVVGRSCHGSMPFEGLTPLEHGGAIIAEAARRHVEGDGFTTHPFLGRGTRTASWADLQPPSDCAVPDRFTFRFDRRHTPLAAFQTLLGLGGRQRATTYHQSCGVE